MSSKMDVPTFHWADYVVFGASLLISLLIGVYFAVMEKRQKSSTSLDFLMAGRNAQTIPVAMSMLASFISAIYIIGVPPEIMLNGTMFALGAGGYLIGAVIGAYVYVPVFHNMGATSVYEYLEERFNRTVRILGSLTFILMMVFYMAVVLYAPALAFTAVTGLSMWVTIFGIGIICTLYTALGGMKAVLWTDTFQMLVIFCGLIALLVKGSLDAGGMSNVMEVAQRGGRIEFDEISIDPRVRHTVWNMLLGNTFGILSLIAGNQIVIQRYLSIQKVQHAQASIFLALSGGVAIMVLVTLLGLVIYAYYDCDPISTGLRPEEVVPTFMMQVLGHLHGLPGLFTASVFAAALSTVSSAVQALAAVFIQDIIHPLYKHYKNREMTDRVTTYIAKALALSFGLLTIGLSYIAPVLGPYLLQIAASIFGTMGGPLFGMFTLAIFFPCANSWGAAIGLITSLAFSLWLNIGAIVTKVAPIPLPPRLDNCTPLHFLNTTSNYTLAFTTYIPNSNISMELTTDGSMNEESSAGINEFYKVSYMWYSVISVSTTVLVGLLVSALTGCRRNKPPLEQRLLFPYTTTCGCSGATCGIDQESKDEVLSSPLLWKSHPSPTLNLNTQL